MERFKDKKKNKKTLTKAGTTLLTGNPPSVSSLPMTSSWHISIAAWSCWDSSPVACRPCSSCWALEPWEKKKYCYLKLTKHKEQLCKGWQVCTHWLRCQWFCETIVTCGVLGAQKDVGGDPWPRVELWGPKQRGLESRHTALNRQIFISKAIEFNITDMCTFIFLTHNIVTWSTNGEPQLVLTIRSRGFDIPWSLPISESSDSLSPEVVMPTAPATELEAGYRNIINQNS